MRHFLPSLKCSAIPTLCGKMSVILEFPKDLKEQDCVGFYPLRLHRHVTYLLRVLPLLGNATHYKYKHKWLLVLLFWYLLIFEMLSRIKDSVGHSALTWAGKIDQTWGVQYCSHQPPVEIEPLEFSSPELSRALSVTCTLILRTE